MQRKSYSAELKAKVALEALKERKTTSEIASTFKLHPHQVTHWKKRALEELPEIFRRGSNEQQKSQEELTASLYQQIGQLTVELDWLKKKMGALG